jgi:hypothetical protein
MCHWMLEWNFCSSCCCQPILCCGRTPNEKEEAFGTFIPDNRECRLHKLNRITILLRYLHLQSVLEHKNWLRVMQNLWLCLPYENITLHITTKL